MKVLFIHQNFPAQFRHLAGALAADDQMQVMAIGSHTSQPLPRVDLRRYSIAADHLYEAHPFARRFNIECHRAEQVLYLCNELIQSGLTPDVVFVHCGWGEALPLRTVFGRAKIVTYFEFFYRPNGQDVDFDREWPAMSIDAVVGLRAKNATTLLALVDTDIAVTPTHWQRSTFPADMRQRLKVCHDGIDVSAARPDPSATLPLPDGTVLRPGDPIVTFVSRNLEPLRGYHVFMRSLPHVLREIPACRVVIVGGDDVSYGASPPHGVSWKDHFLKEVRDRIDVSRVHYLGRVEYNIYIRLLQVSAVHVYLTYPFVLSWSLLEAMATGCILVASATPPVLEVMTADTGLLVDFFDHHAVARAIVSVLRDPARFHAMRRAAREKITNDYHRDDCVRAMLSMIDVLPTGEQKRF